MSRIRRITVRLNPDKKMDKEIIDFIETIDKSRFKTVNNAVISTLYDNICGKTKDIVSEKNFLPDNIVDEILSALKSALTIELPKFLVSIYGEIIGSYKSADTVAVLKTDDTSLEENDIDMDFLGG